MAKLGLWAWSIFLLTIFVGFQNAVLILVGSIVLIYIAFWIYEEYEHNKNNKELERKYGKPDQKN